MNRRRKLIEAMQQGDRALLESLGGADEEEVQAPSTPTARARRASVRRCWILYLVCKCNNVQAVMRTPYAASQQLASAHRASIRPPSGGRWRVRRRSSKPDSGSLADTLTQLDRESLGASTIAKALSYAASHNAILPRRACAPR